MPATTDPTLRSGEAARATSAPATTLPPPVIAPASTLTLMQLPPELLRLVARNLTPAGYGCFMVCSRTTLACLGDPVERDLLNRRTVARGRALLAGMRGAGTALQLTRAVVAAMEFLEDAWSYLQTGEENRLLAAQLARACLGMCMGGGTAPLMGLVRVDWQREPRAPGLHLALMQALQGLAEALPPTREQATILSMREVCAELARRTMCRLDASQRADFLALAARRMVSAPDRPGASDALENLAQLLHLVPADERPPLADALRDAARALPEPAVRRFHQVLQRALDTQGNTVDARRCTMPLAMSRRLPLPGYRP